MSCERRVRSMAVAVAIWRTTVTAECRIGTIEVSTRQILSATQTRRASTAHATHRRTTLTAL